MLCIPLILEGCKSVPVLTEKEAKKIQVKELNYPGILDHEIFCSDPAHAKKIIDSGLEKIGFVEVDRTQKLKNIGKPLVHFTSKSKPYLLPVNEKEQSLYLRRVRIAEEDIAEISIKENVDDVNNTVLVEFTTFYKNLTPFARLMVKNALKGQKSKISFRWKGDKWILDKNK